MLHSDYLTRNTPSKKSQMLQVSIKEGSFHLASLNNDKFLYISVVIFCVKRFHFVACAVQQVPDSSCLVVLRELLVILHSVNSVVMLPQVHNISELLNYVFRNAL